MQGIKIHIPAKEKAKYIQSLLGCGFDTIDFGSFVSPKAIPQMQDTAEVLGLLDLSRTQSKLLAIVANVRGAQDACEHEAIDYLGFPFSISENFQMRNTHKTIDQSVETLKGILELADRHGKEVVTYISMGFGNPYGDPWNVEIVGEWTEKLAEMGTRILSLSDTIGSSTPEVIDYLFSNLIPKYPDIEFGAHLHTTPTKWMQPIKQAVVVLMAPFKALVVVPWPRMSLLGICPPKRCCPILPSKKRIPGSIGWCSRQPSTRQLSSFRYTTKKRHPEECLYLLSFANNY